jgi:hypothetical protein
MDQEFGDSSPDDAYSEGDEEVDWSQVEKVAGQIDSINAIENDDERRRAAEAQASELNGAA